MISFSLSEAAEILNGQLHGQDRQIDTISTDTRNIEESALFIAIVGERFDAHDFCEQAKEKGAAALLVSRLLPVELPQIVVKDTTHALGSLSAWVHKKSNSFTIAMTGSCGKTTVKEMLSAILRQKGNVLATLGNFNNDIGVPLTLLRSEAANDYSVIELGANHIGEIAYTTRLVEPNIALVNNVAAAHLEGFGSMDGVKQAKGEIYQGLSQGDVAVVNLDSNGGDYWKEVLADKKVITLSASDNNADFYASDVQISSEGLPSFTLHTPKGEVPVTLTLVGEHNVGNAVAAAALGQNAGATLTEIQSGLANMTNVSGRVEVIELNDNVRLIDDSYNASVPAMKAAADLLSHYEGTRWLILGYMAELGDESLELHRQVGQHSAPFNFEYVLTYGDDTKVISEECGGQHFASHDAMIQFIKQQLEIQKNQTHTLLVKGANSAGMSKVVAALKEIQ
ncbi:UDP-N-acetylmuramoyl-tripeptide--D-alanyl-D-alanine ligase [Vibrio nigripulchritudo]|uniref:UDP-N-acetylmuramoyl-tripeptide--D-alanyl-D- alanine ligase n=1 Tax=Vibrio nigripulchritudo TaxID=28173 RepID=UPI0005F9E289|nr:UDP-N-acetylmuramoyl-tripeptide--D-alanyl-D-alanine ligase [Vibrio nigripulchritudo]KJY71715.1 UDP-N-acetylmuramoyl-tripeptide--D-alanyl-D-alanine ligase [Vibrio nigripulchritudo]